MSHGCFEESITRPDKLIRVYASLITENQGDRVSNRILSSDHLPDPYLIELPDIFGTILYQMALEAWLSTGHGNHLITSETENGKVRITFHSGTSYRAYVSKEKLSELRRFRNYLHKSVQTSTRKNRQN